MEDLARLKEKILGYRLEGSSLGNLGYTRILLQVCGSAGHGKSSLINSLKYALHSGAFSVSAPVAPAQESQGGFTMVRLPYELTEVITLVDNRGFGKLDDFEREEVYAQLANIHPLNKEVRWDRSYEERMMEVTAAAPNTNDLLVPIFVHSMEKLISDDAKSEMMEFFQTTQNITGFLPILVLTKKLSPNAKELRGLAKTMSAEKTVFEVENYTEENHIRSPGKDEVLLTILSTALDLVDFVANNVVPTLETPEKEHLKRVQMLLMMARDNDAQRESSERAKENPPPPRKKKNSCTLL